MAAVPIRPTLRDTVRWLLEADHERERNLLAFLRSGPHTASELKSFLGLKHDPQVHRALDALDDLGLLERYYDTGKTRRGQVYEASPLGTRAIELVERVESFIDEHATRARA